MAAFARIPEGTTKVDLSCNYLKNRKPSVLAAAFTQIPLSVTALDVGYTDLLRSQFATKAFAALRENIREIIFSPHDFIGEPSENGVTKTSTALCTIHSI